MVEGRKAFYNGYCKICKDPITAEKDYISKTRTGYWVHVDCLNRDPTDDSPRPKQKFKKPVGNSITNNVKIINSDFIGFRLDTEKIDGNDFFLNNRILKNYISCTSVQLLDDYHDHFSSYKFKILKVPREHPLSKRANLDSIISKQNLILKLVNKKETVDWKPIVFGIVNKVQKKGDLSVNGTMIVGASIMNVFGKINRRLNPDKTYEYFIEQICDFRQGGSNSKATGIPMPLHDDFTDAVVTKDVSYYEKEIIPSLFLELFSDFIQQNYPHTESSFKEKRKKIQIVEGFDGVGDTSEELGFKEKHEEEEQMESNVDEDEYDPKQRVKEILAEPIRKLSPELEKKIQECTNKLCIDDKYIRQIIHHLASGRHVLIGGAIGTGKSHFVREFLGEFWATEKSPKGYNVEFFTATDEWSTVDVIGGIMPDTEKEELRYKFQDGCLTKKVENCTESLQFPRDEYQGDWLAIDEFNRADIEKAFGQLFTAIEDGKLRIPGRRVGQQHTLRDEIEIPKQFRIIGMMNTSDKHFLYPIHDALKRRFAYVEIMPPTRAEREKEIKAARQNASDAIYPSGIIPIGIDENKELEIRINSAYELLAGIRSVKGLGTAILKAIIQELISAMDSDQRVYTKVSISAGNDPDEILDWSLTANLLPQFQGIKTETLLIFERMFVYANAKTPQDLFSEITTDPEKIEEFNEGWKMFVQTITDDAPETNNEYDLKSQIEKMNLYTEMWDRKKEKLGIDPNSQFAKKLRVMIESGD